VKVTPAHDPNDYEVGLRHNLPMVNIFIETAHVNENGGKYQGLDRFDARKPVKTDLVELGLLVEGEAPRACPGRVAALGRAGGAAAVARSGSCA
jgi:valyl-tRNA synthetase